MKKSPKIAIIVFAGLAALALCAPMVAAQDNMGGNPEAMQRLEKMSAALQLTPQQKQQVAPIIMAEAPKVKALKSDTSMAPMQKAMKMRQISEATDAKMKPILNPQQYQTLMQMQAQERQEMIQKMENR
jgi:Spy/CpxP family protein refolding chaperone